MSIEESQVCSVAEDVWSSLLGLSLVTRGPGALEGADEVLSAVVQITGAWQGVVVIQCPRRLAHRAAVAMFAGEASSDEVRDALGELSNVIGGNVKALLPSPSKLSIPSVRPEWVSVPNDAGRLSVEAWLDCEGDPVVVSVVEHPNCGEAEYANPDRR